jgi:hypothetical protein
LHASELPPETAGESSQVNTRLKFKKRTGTTLPDRDQKTGFSGGPVQFKERDSLDGRNSSVKCDRRGHPKCPEHPYSWSKMKP